MRVGFEIDDFLTPELRHHRLDQHVSGSVGSIEHLCGEVWRALGILQSDAYDAGAKQILDKAHEHLGAACTMIGQLIAADRELLTRTRVEVEERLRSTQAQHDANVTALISECEAKVSAIATERDALQTQMVAEVSTLVSEHEADVAAIVAERDARVAEIAIERDAAQERASAIETSTAWKATSPLRRLLASQPRLRLLSRRTAKLGWWAMSGQLARRISDWRRMRAR
jgi:hypothetical protein